MNEHAGKEAHLLIQSKFDRFLPLSRSRNPYFNSQLLRSEDISQKCLRLTFTEYDTRKTSCFTSATKMLDDGVGTEDVGCDIKRIWAVNTVVFATVEEADCSSFWRFWRELGVERNEPRVRYMFWGQLVNV